MPIHGAHSIARPHPAANPHAAKDSPKPHFTDMDFEKQVELNTKLFLTYLKNQTPDDKVDTQHMMNTMLAMMTGSQQIKTNKILTDQYQLQQSMHQMAMNQYLGKEVDYCGQHLQLQQGPVDIQVTLPKIPQKANVLVVDSLGRLIQSLELIPTVEAQTVTWDGMSRQGQRAQPGLYQVFVHATDSDGQDFTADPVAPLKIDSVEPGVNGGAPVLKASGIPLDVEHIRAVRLPRSPFQGLPLNADD